MAEVVTFPKTNLNDVVSHLRALADGIERGDFGEVPTLFVILPKEEEKDWPVLFGYGINADAPQFVFQMELAKHWFVNNISKRT